MAPIDPTTPQLPSLAQAAWLQWPVTRRFFAALARRGQTARIVGGAVRNALLRLPVADVDAATPARPDEVAEACREAGLQVVPTGLAHGTVTVLADGRAIEVTTLRRDQSTDGRHATVAFTADWAEDARRRDFTMNAIYCDAEGRLFDPLDGYRDVQTRRVRFIGNADHRIREDYLRILRFFRFHATYAEGPPDPVAIAACARNRDGLARLSAERIRAEIMKLLVADRAADAVAAMAAIGNLQSVLGAAPRPGLMAHVVDAEASLATAPDAILRLSGLAMAVEDDRTRLSARLRLSNEERAALLVIDAMLMRQLGQSDAPAARRQVYRVGANVGRRQAVALLAVAPDHAAAARTLHETAATWTIPRLPVSGSDLLRLGVTPGPAVGELLAALETWWVDNDFPDRDAVKVHLASLVAA